MSALLAALATVLFAARLVLFGVLHLRPGGVHPVRDTVSDYAASAVPGTRRLAAVASWCAAAAWAVLGAAVLTLQADGARSPGLGIALLALALVLTVLPAVPTDVPGQELTLRGRLHLLLAIAWFTLAYSTIGPSQDLLHRLGVTGTAVLDVLHPVGAIALIALVASMMLTPLRAWTFGLSERVFILAVTLAPLLVAAHLALL